MSPSSPVAPVVDQCLLDVLAGAPDPRDRRGRRHHLAGLLAIAVAGVAAGARSLVAIGEWAQDVGVDALSAAGLIEPGRALASESTIRRALQAVDPDDLAARIGAWTLCRAGADWQGRRVIAIDGKTVRGARPRDRRDGTLVRSAPHLLAAFTHATGTVIGQVGVDVKTNEITALPALLSHLDITNAVVTADALHTQKTTCEHIVSRGGHYVLTVKGNQPTLLRRLKRLPWKDVPTRTCTTTGHGRRVTRTIKVVDTPAWIHWPGVAQVAQIRRTRTTKGKKSVEVVYVITSLTAQQAQPGDLADLVQGHWGIENRLHWVRDVTYDEDRHQLRTHHGPAVMAVIRNTAISLLRLAGHTSIAAALRHHARDRQRPLQLITRPW